MCLSAASLYSVRPEPSSAQAMEVKRGFVRERPALHYKTSANRDVECELCPKRCRVGDGGKGFCRVRKNVGGKYYTLVHSNPCAVNIDPIEKKPFFHVLPGTRSFSLATAGCNFECKFCQNWEISQSSPEEVMNYDLPPDAVLKLALENGCRSVASTYVEPTIFYEYMLDLGKEAKKNGILSTNHSNGYINPRPLEELSPFLDAACIDLKAFDEKYYREICDGSLEPVLATLKNLRRLKVHTEIVNLVVPGKNDDRAKIRAMCEWIVKELGADTPVHFTRFYPTYKMKSLTPTPAETLDMAAKTGKSAGLNFVYVGNLPGHPLESTFCPKCDAELIKRTGYRSKVLKLSGGKCADCGRAIPGIWS